MNDTAHAFVEKMDQMIHAPSMRGISHLAAAGVAIVGVIALIAKAPTGMQITAGVIYGLGMALLLTVSGVYHRFKINPRIGPFLRRLDHSMIFVFIASTYTPFLMLALDGGWRIATMVLVWVLCTAGVAVRMAIPHVHRLVLVGMLMGVGWLAVPLIPAMLDALDTRSFVLIAVGGALYTIGAIVYATQRPRLVPNHFGFHELFHLFVVAGAVCHFAAIWPLLTAPVA
jgi:hemolysin III